MLKTLADRLAVVKAKTFSDTLGHVKATNLLPRYKRWKPRQLAADCAMWLARHWWTGHADTIPEVRVRMMLTELTV